MGRMVLWPGPRAAFALIFSSREGGKGGAYHEWIKKDRLSIRIHEKIPLKNARKAHEDLEGRKTSGKLLLIP